MSSNRSDYSPEEIRERIHFLDVRAEDLRGCASLEQEFTVILRKTSDLKAFSDPCETGFAGRIREINKAHRVLKKMYDDREIHSFSQFLQDEDPHHDNNGNDESSQSSEPESAGIGYTEASHKDHD